MVINFVIHSRRLTIKLSSTNNNGIQYNVITFNPFQDLDKAYIIMKTIAEPNTLKFPLIMVRFESYDEDFLKGIYDSFNEDMKISLTVDKYRIFPNDSDHHGRSVSILRIQEHNYFHQSSRHLKWLLKTFTSTLHTLKLKNL
ncbi:hypothetical protein CEXT_802301 [Caerostris extrusa]|uniref:Uncharacterized protein n=1 Tax=Caerostris extrusa TaxID=172846 RepID=A0AAV4NU89_CAEEX|nr:hypothetical protein CEXT_802301 [Caerostris extrusa]